MPPKTRGKKSSKASKENTGVSCKATTKVAGKAVKGPRKALADKTNSASDDNASYLQTKPSAILVENEENLLVKQRPRRERRLPSRYVESNEIENLLNSKNVSMSNIDNSKSTPVKKNPVIVLTPLKTPRLKLSNSLIARRPKRICRLPSKFDDHSISPSKYIPVQPSYASTPKILNKPKIIAKKDSSLKVKTKITPTSSKVISNESKEKRKEESKKRTVNKKINDTSLTYSLNSSADTNNNARTNQLPRSKPKNKPESSPKVLLPHRKAKASKKPGDKDLSIRILEDRKTSLKRDASNFDVYEFTYDPSEEPPPQKKKRKKPVKKREPKPKTLVFKDNYDKNVAKALTTLKNTISKKTIPKPDNIKLATETCTAHPVTETVVTTFETQPVSSNPCNLDKSHTSMKNYNSVRVEDIALDFEQDSCLDDINYSPLHSFCQPSAPAVTITTPNEFNNTAPSNEILKRKQSLANDPLNLRENLSFFDDQPVASSSMNVSTRNPAASPWRVEFENLPIKWQVNTYVKPNMTPAFESSFIKFNENKKKHVYTDMVTDTNEESDLPQVYEDYSSKLKQTSIFSYIKEVVEKNAKKKKEKTTPIKRNSLFEDIESASANSACLPQNNYVTPKKIAQSNVQSDEQNTPSSTSNISNENEVFSDNSKENGKESSKHSSKNSSKKKRDKNVTYFGFDDSENHDQENISPIKKIDKRKLRALKPRSRAVLQEINKQNGPTRAAMPVAVKSKPVQSSDMANKLFDQMKSATEPPVFPDENLIQSTEATNITEAQNNIDSNDDQSVHLFEDIEVVHHLKTHRKSYGKAKKAVKFQQNSISDSDVPLSDAAEQSASSDEDDSLDLTFKVPAMEPKKTTRKKKSKKTKISKKEAQEVEAWAAGFNSMCEDIEEFDLVVE